MPWLDRPAGVYTRHEVVLHRLDDPLVLSITHPGGKLPTLYEVWELRLQYVFDASHGKWEVQAVKPFGYRRHSNTARIEIQGSSPEIRALAQKYAPDWIPDPSKARMELPAEDVWAEAANAIMNAIVRVPTMTKAMYARLDQAVRDAAPNPYTEEAP